MLRYLFKLAINYKYDIITKQKICHYFWCFTILRLTVVVNWLANNFSQQCSLISAGQQYLVFNIISWHWVVINELSQRRMNFLKLKSKNKFFFLLSFSLVYVLKINFFFVKLLCCPPCSSVCLSISESLQLFSAPF